ASAPAGSRAGSPAAPSDRWPGPAPAAARRARRYPPAERRQGRGKPSFRAPFRRIARCGAKFTSRTRAPSVAGAGLRRPAVRPDLGEVVGDPVGIVEPHRDQVEAAELVERG